MELPTLDKFPKGILAQIDIQTAFIASRLVIAAERLQVFRTLHEESLSADAIGKRLRIHRYYLEPFLKSLVALGLLRAGRDRYSNTPFADGYFVDQRSIHWTRQYSAECVENYEALTVLEEALAGGKRYGAIRKVPKSDYLARMQRDRRYASDFTQMLFHLHQPEAAALAGYLRLAGRRAVLDVGGGSGVMSIALAEKNPHLRASILDTEPVCRIAAANVRQAGLSGRIATLPGDIRKTLPRGFDVVLMCDIGPVLPSLPRHAYECLPPGGMLVLADRYLNDDGTRPLDRLLAHFVTDGFGLATRRDMVEAVQSAGFRAVRSRKILPDLWCITGTRPDE
jgi:3-hydroxy-5-methyl-1-naphthoate 3-O-methyltransferase